MNPDGPWLTTAVFCNTVREPPAYKSLDLIGVFNEIRRTPGTNTQHKVFLFMNVVRGYAEGPQKLRITSTLPSGKVELVNESEFRLTREKVGHNMKAPLVIPILEPGIVWFDIFLNDELATRTCVRVRYDALP